MPGFYDEVEAAICGPDGGILAGAAKGAIVVVASTITPAQAKDLAARCAERGIRFVDAPVCQGAERGAQEAYLRMAGRRCRRRGRGGPSGHGAVRQGDLPPRRGRRRHGRQGNEQHAALGGAGGRPRGARHRREPWRTEGEAHPGAVALQRHHLAARALEGHGIGFHGLTKDMQIVLEMGDQARLTLPIAGCCASR